MCDRKRFVLLCLPSPCLASRTFMWGPLGIVTYLPPPLSPQPDTMNPPTHFLPSSGVTGRVRWIRTHLQESLIYWPANSHLLLRYSNSCPLKHSIARGWSVRLRQHYVAMHMRVQGCTVAYRRGFLRLSLSTPCPPINLKVSIGVRSISVIYTLEQVFSRSSASFTPSPQLAIFLKNPQAQCSNRSPTDTKHERLCRGIAEQHPAKHFLLKIVPRTWYRSLAPIRTDDCQVNSCIILLQAMQFQFELAASIS
jgi:hypothetical protein